MYKVEYLFFGSIFSKIFDNKNEACEFACQVDGVVYDFDDDLPF